jgi:hypothetical protein
MALLPSPALPANVPILREPFGEVGDEVGYHFHAGHEISHLSEYCICLHHDSVVEATLMEQNRAPL